MDKYRWLQLAGITSELQDLMSEGSVTFPQNAVELIALLAFQEKYEANAHPVVVSWFRKNHLSNTKVLGQIKRKVQKGEPEETGTHRQIVPQFAKSTGRMTDTEDPLGTEGKYEEEGSKSTARRVGGQETGKYTPTPANTRGFKASQIPYKSAGGGSDKYVKAEVGSTNISSGPLSGDTEAKRGGDKEIPEDLKWSDEFAEKIKKAVKDALPDAPRNYQLVNIAQHQHKNGHPDVLLIWQKAAKDMTENEILSFSSYRDKFADFNNPTEAEIEKMMAEIKEGIDGVLLWPIHVKTGNTPRFSAIASDPNMITTGSAIESILGTNVSFQNLSTKLGNAWRLACRAPVAAIPAKGNKPAVPAVPGGSVKAASSSAALKTALDGFKIKIMEWFDEKFKVTQYELRITGVTSFVAAKDRIEVTDIDDRDVDAELKEYDTKPLINRSTVTVTADSTSTAKLKFTIPPAFTNPGAKTEYQVTINTAPSGNRVDLNSLPKMDFSNPDELRLAITQAWGTTVNVEDFVSGTEKNPEYNWEAIEALFGTPFDQEEKEEGIITTASRNPMADHGWFGAAIKNDDVKGQKVTLNTLVANKRLSKEFLKDIGLMEAFKYSITNMLLEDSKSDRKKELMMKRNRRTGKSSLNYTDSSEKSKMVHYFDQLGMEDGYDEWEKLRKDQDKNSDGVLTPLEVADWKTEEGIESDPRYNPTEEELAQVSNDVREFEGKFVNLPIGVTPDTELPIEKIWSQIILPAMEKMSSQDVEFDTRINDTRNKGKGGKKNFGKTPGFDNFTIQKQIGTPKAVGMSNEPKDKRVDFNKTVKEESKKRKYSIAANLLGE